MAFGSSIDAIQYDLNVNKKMRRIPFNRTINTGATSAAGRWHECLGGAGTNGPMTLTGTAGVGVACNKSTPGALQIGSDVATDIRRLIRAWALTPSALVAPATLLLTDIIHMYRSCVLVTTPSTLSAHPTWTGTGDTRMTSADGVQASFVETVASSAAGQITPTYTNQAGTTGRTTAAPNGSLWGPVAATPVGALWGESGVTATPGGPFMPLAAGDTGVQKIDSYAINAGATGGAGTFILHRPVASIPLAAASLATDISYIGDIMERIYDDSCLGFFINIGGAITTGLTIQGELVVGWGS
jgi:hypothetical protein